jgi:hypothetical protein
VHSHDDQPGESGPTTQSITINEGTELELAVGIMGSPSSWERAMISRSDLAIARFTVDAHILTIRACAPSAWHFWRVFRTFDWQTTVGHRNAGVRDPETLAVIGRIL